MVGKGVSALLGDASSKAYRPFLGTILKKFGKNLVQQAAHENIRIAIMRKDVEADSFPNPLHDSMGYFSERTIYLRSLAPVVVGHEFAHALDYILGKGKYFSQSDAYICAAFKNARWFVSARASTSVTAYFAEAMRFYVGIDHVECRWHNLSRKKLCRVDPVIHEILARLFKSELQ